MHEPSHIDIYSGIGGFSLAAEAAGFRTVAFAELDPEASLVLAEHWPHVPNVRDIRAARWDRVRRSLGRPALLTGGVPCQPASLLGKRLGSADERWLWPDTLRIVRILRPRFCLFENPPAILTLEDGRAFSGIVGGLAALGYDVLWGSVFAAAVDAGHLRERCCIVALNSDTRHSAISWQQRGQREEMGREQFDGQLCDRAITRGKPNKHCAWAIHSDTDSGRREAGTGLRQGQSRWIGRRRSGDFHGEEIGLGPNADLPRLQGHGGDEHDEGRQGGRKAGSASESGIRLNDLRGRVFPAGEGEPPWWHEAHTGVPVLAHGVSTKLAEAAARCSGNSVVPQAWFPILKALRDQI